MSFTFSHSQLLAIAFLLISDNNLRNAYNAGGDTPGGKKNRHQFVDIYCLPQTSDNSFFAPPPRELDVNR